MKAEPTTKMNSEQIKKLAAAGLTVEQIALVADMMIEARNENVAQGSLGAGFLPNKPPGARGEESWPGKNLGLPKGHPVHLTRPDPHPDSWGTENR